MDYFDMPVIVDPNLGDRLLDRIRSRLPKVNLLVIEDPTYLDCPQQRRAGRERARQVLRSRRWPIVYSGYQEMLFKQADLDCIVLPINCHPSRPEIPGMSYDVGPLIEDSATYGICGATLHFMTAGIDEGQIYEVREEAVPDDADYLWVRRRNQQFCVDLTDDLCECIAWARDLGELRQCLDAKVQRTDRRWGQYISTPMRDASLLEIYQRDPNHPALRGNAKFHKLLAKVGETRSSGV